MSKFEYALAGLNPDLTVETLADNLPDCILEERATGTNKHKGIGPFLTEAGEMGWELCAALTTANEKQLLVFKRQRT